MQDPGKMGGQARRGVVDDAPLTSGFRSIMGVWVGKETEGKGGPVQQTPTPDKMQARQVL